VQLSSWRRCSLDAKQKLPRLTDVARQLRVVPETAVPFKQQLGRLIRPDEDHGRATILDHRLVSRRWGGLLMRGVPG
jgi:Rad3-related DNA helicase